MILHMFCRFGYRKFNTKLLNSQSNQPYLLTVQRIQSAELSLCPSKDILCHIINWFILTIHMASDIIPQRPGSRLNGGLTCVMSVAILPLPPVQVVVWEMKSTG